MRVWTLPLALACRCGPGPEPAPSESDSGAATCDVTIEGSYPVSSATDAWYRDDISFRLSAPDPTATLETDIPGAQAWSADGETLTWVLSEPLTPSTDYLIALHWCGGTTTLAFRTSEVGLPAEVDLTGRTYALDFADARALAPAGVGSILTSYMTTPVLLGVASDDGAPTLRLAHDAEDLPYCQDWCEPTVDLPASFAAAPYVEAGTGTLPLVVAGVSATLEELHIAGTFAPDGTLLHRVVLTGIFDTRPFAPLFGDGEDAFCVLAESGGAATCEACPADGEPFCLAFVLDRLDAPLLECVALLDIPSADCAGCESGPPEECP